MRLEIDTLEKRIRIETEVNLYKLFTLITAIFLDNSWQDFTIESALMSPRSGNNIYIADINSLKEKPVNLTEQVKYDVEVLN